MVLGYGENGPTELGDFVLFQKYVRLWAFFLVRIYGAP